MGFKERYDGTLAELAEVCRAAGRDPREVRVVAVSKTVGLPEVREAVAAGAHDFGENRPDLLAEKASALPGERWHFIGNVQSRKIPEIVAHASMVHSLYQEHHLARFDAAAAAAGRTLDVLLEVNVSGEQSKSGLAPADAAHMVQACAAFPHLRLRGLMTMAPQGDLRIARECFDDLVLLRNSLRAGMEAERAAAFDEVSMGMSEDWREAVAAGATIVRIGRALFSEQFTAPHQQL